MSTQPRSLTLVELASTYGVYGGLGYLAAGAVGLWCGAALVTALYGRLIWLAARPPSAGRGQPGHPDG